MGRVRITTVAVENQQVLRILSVCVVTQYTKRMRHIAMCCLPGSTIFFHIISKTGTISETKVIEHKMCLIFSKTFV
jgi:hypothetical protein